MGRLLISNPGFSDYEITVLSRTMHRQSNHVRYTLWDGKTLGDWVKEIEGAKAVINFSGERVSCRHTPENKELILQSRIQSTACIGNAISMSKSKPEIWINAGALYGEVSEPGIGFSHNQPDFLRQVSTQWEDLFHTFHILDTKKYFLKIGNVFGEEGILHAFRRLVDLRLGNKIGTGRQYISWIHQEDFVRVVLWILENKIGPGIIHCTSEYPVMNQELMREIRKRASVRLGIPLRDSTLRILAYLAGFDPCILLKSTKVYPVQLTNSGFKFKYPTIEEALDDLMK